MNSDNDTVLSPEQIRGDASTRLLREWVIERRSDRRWKTFRRVSVSLIFLATTVLYLGNYMGLLGYKMLPYTPTVAIVPINGAIGLGQSASADAVNPLLEKLFHRKAVEGIVLVINSGGGSPSEAERIAANIDRLREKTGKPIYAACSSMCASAAYMIALHTDRLYAGEYSWVGSIGVVLKGWDLKDVAERVNVAQRVYVSGPMKDLLNPFKDLPPEMDAKLRGLVNDTAQSFYAEVRAQRGEKLEGDGSELFTGEVWTAPQSLAHGLIDEIATLEQVVAQNFGETQTKSFSPKQKKSGFFERFASQVGHEIADRLGGQSLEVEM